MWPPFKSFRDEGHLQPCRLPSPVPHTQPRSHTGSGSPDTLLLDTWPEHMAQPRRICHSSPQGVPCLLTDSVPGARHRGHGLLPGFAVANLAARKYSRTPKLPWVAWQDPSWRAVSTWLSRPLDLLLRPAWPTATWPLPGAGPCRTAASHSVGPHKVPVRCRLL